MWAEVVNRKTELVEQRKIDVGENPAEVEIERKTGLGSFRLAAWAIKLRPISAVAVEQHEQRLDEELI